MPATMSRGTDHTPEEGQRRCQINISAPPHIRQEVEQLARAEWRNLSQMALVLLAEAIEARRKKRDQE